MLCAIRCIELLLCIEISLQTAVCSALPKASSAPLKRATAPTVLPCREVAQGSDKAFSQEAQSSRRWAY